MLSHQKKDKKPKEMTAKLEEAEEKPKNLDSLKFSEIRRFLDKIAKSLGFRLFHCPLYSRKSYWLLSVDDDTVVFLDGCNRDEFQTAKALLAGILKSRIFKLRSVKSYDEKLLENPFYSLTIPELQLKLDIFLAA